MRTASPQLATIGLLGLSLALAGCDGSGSAVALQPSDLQPTRLSAAERDVHAGVCRKAWQGSVVYSTRGAGNVMTESAIERMCDCFIDRLENGTNRIEFLIGMQVIAAMSNAPRSRPAAPLPPQKVPSLKELAAAAGKIGVNEARFQEMAAQARKVGEPAMMQCLERVTASR